VQLPSWLLLGYLAILVDQGSLSTSATQGYLSGMPLFIIVLLPSTSICITRSCEPDTWCCTTGDCGRESATWLLAPALCSIIRLSRKNDSLKYHLSNRPFVWLLRYGIYADTKAWWSVKTVTLLLSSVPEQIPRLPLLAWWSIFLLCSISCHICIGYWMADTTLIFLFQYIRKLASVHL